MNDKSPKPTQQQTSTSAPTPPKKKSAVKIVEEAAEDLLIQEAEKIAEADGPKPAPSS